MDVNVCDPAWHLHEWLVGKVFPAMHLKLPIHPRSSVLRAACAAAVLAVAGTAAAAPAKKKQAAASSPPASSSPPPGAVVEPAPKPSWLKRLKSPFKRGGAVEPGPAPSPEPAPNAEKPAASKTSAKNNRAKPAGPAPAGPGSTSAPPGAARKAGTGGGRPVPAGPATVQTQPQPRPGSAPAVAESRKRGATAPSPAPAGIIPAPAPGPAPMAVEETKKPGFFARLKNKLKGTDAAGEVPGMEKPERPADWQERSVITEDGTAFFMFGPSQSGGPDFRLGKGMVVKVAQAGKGWTRVELENGRLGYVGSDVVRAAQESDFAGPGPGPGPAPTQVAARSESLQPWTPAPQAPDLPELPMAAGTENSLFLLPPLEGQKGTAAKNAGKGGPPAIDPPSLDEPPLNPGDVVKTLEIQDGKPAADTSDPLPAPATPPAGLTLPSKKTSTDSEAPKSPKSPETSPGQEGNPPASPTEPKPGSESEPELPPGKAGDESTDAPAPAPAAPTQAPAPAAVNPSAPQE
ncbi:MAG: hypothetical protein JWM59_1830 [Verrucomicrobiales bacterium]|nr:hypothetical protein [Verrucomicrobiales bacterium]